MGSVIQRTRKRINQKRKPSVSDHHPTSTSPIQLYRPSSTVDRGRHGGWEYREGEADEDVQASFVPTWFRPGREVLFFLVPIKSGYE
jgi:hypothetical protein